VCYSPHCQLTSHDYFLVAGVPAVYSVQSVLVSISLIPRFLFATRLTVIITTALVVMLIIIIFISVAEYCSVAVYLSGNAFTSINVFVVYQARLVLGWVTVSGQITI